MNNATSNLKSFGDKADEVRIRTAESLESAADSVRAAGSEGAEAISGLAKGAGKTLDDGATRVRSFTGIDVIGDLRSTVRRNPVGSLAIAVAVGLIAGFWSHSSSKKES